MPSFAIITVDGGAAAGKSTTARTLAERCSFLHVDTGAHYRTITAALLASDVQPADREAIDAFLTTVTTETQIQGSSARLILNKQQVDHSLLRSEAVNERVSQIASIPTVRAFLKEYQRSQATIARERGFNGLVMEGRDIGSVIFPDATLHVFLEADPATRAARRASEGIIDSILERDRLDQARKEAPLTCPSGALRINTGTRTPEQVVQQIIDALAGACSA